MIRPTVARVDLGAIKSNFRTIADHLQREQPAHAPGVVAVVKANAYGHGAAPVARALESVGVICWRAPTSRRRGARATTSGRILVFGAAQRQRSTAVRLPADADHLHARRRRRPSGGSGAL
jgi:alanine racemase